MAKWHGCHILAVVSTVSSPPWGPPSAAAWGARSCTACFPEVQTFVLVWFTIPPAGIKEGRWSITSLKPSLKRLRSWQRGLGAPLALLLSGRSQCCSDCNPIARQAEVTLWQKLFAVHVILEQHSPHVEGGVFHCGCCLAASLLPKRGVFLEGPKCWFKVMNDWIWKPSEKNGELVKEKLKL